MDALFKMEIQTVDHSWQPALGNDLEILTTVACSL